MTTKSANPNTGVLIMVLSVLGFAIMDAIGKKHSTDFPAFQVLATRTIPIVLLALLIFVFISKKSIDAELRIKPGCFFLQSLRGLVWAITATLFYFSFAEGSLTYVYIITFLHPVFGQILAVSWLRRSFKKHIILPVILMFVGVVVGIWGQNSEGNNIILILAVLAAFFFALEFILTEQIQEEYPEVGDVTTLFYTSFTGFIILIAIAFLVAPLFGTEKIWVAPDLPVLGVMFLAGLFGGLANLGIIVAMRYADSRVLAPWDYAILPFAALIDYFCFDEVLQPSILVSGTIIAAGGIWLLKSDQKVDD